MMSQARKNKKSFGTFIIEYRKIIVLSLFFIILPIAIIVGVYSGTKVNGEKVKFAAEAEVVSTKKFMNVTEFSQFQLNVEYTRLADYYDPEDATKKLGNSYTFTIKYEKTNQEVSDVVVTTSLVAPWSTYQEFKAPLNLTESRVQTFVFEFKKMVPYKPLWFVEVKNPILYMELKYKIAGLEHTQYLMYDLNTANNVIVS
ncbi:MAG TPA: hypothetical protein GX003_02825 [Acholeplasmataceae bacterium]|jgi:hypothetical protein|nr:hypothetical protein [Acholeplasmataceae bacterium]